MKGSKDVRIITLSTALILLSISIWKDVLQEMSPAIIILATLFVIFSIKLSSFNKAYKITVLRVKIWHMSVQISRLRQDYTMQMVLDFKETQKLIDDLYQKRSELKQELSKIN